MKPLQRRLLLCSLIVGLLTSAVSAESGPVERPSPGSRPLKLICYNVFNSFNHGRSYKLGVKWLKAQKADVLALQELVGWNEERLKKAALEWGHKHVVAMKGGGYNIGFTSKTPIEVIERHPGSPFHHGYVHCRIQGIDMIVAHLWPANLPFQMRESNTLKKLVVRLSSEGREVILTGDFNASFASDEHWLRIQEPLLKKWFNGDARRKEGQRFFPNNELAFDVMENLLAAPFVDVVRVKFDKRYKRPSAPFSRKKLGSFPTTILPHFKTVKLQLPFMQRIDHILATPKLAKTCTRAEVLHSPPVLERISDHYPVVAVFKVARVRKP